MKKLNSFILSAASFLIALPLASAAPFPRATPSASIEPQVGLYNTDVGFKIEARNTNWSLGTAPNTSQGIESLFYSPSRKEGGRGLLTVRVDKNVEVEKLESYMDKWNKEYPRYGFDVLGSRTFSLDGRKGYVVDLINREKDRQMRQVIYFKDKTAVILSCRDDLKHFETSLKNCNSIMKSFAWVESESQPETSKATN